MLNFNLNFKTAADFYAAASKTAPGIVYTSATDNHLNFKGLDNYEIIKSKYGYPDGVKKLNELPGAEQIRTARSVLAWSEIDGDDGDQERLMDGRPFLTTRRKARGAGLKNAIQIIVNIGENCNIDYERMLWKTYTAAKLADEMEAQGVRCEIIAAVNIAGTYGNGTSFKMQAIIKNADEPLNVSLLCATLSPWFFRHWCLALMATTSEKCVSNFGSAKELEKENFPNAIIIDNGECLNKADAENFLKNFTITQEA